MGPVRVRRVRTLDPEGKVRGGADKQWNGMVSLAGGSAATSCEKGSIMKAFGRNVMNFLVNEDGPTATEYAVMLALIIVVAITAITTLGQSVTAKFEEVDAGINGAGAGS
jgi:pilus assembly protein Flp/PilA